MFRVLSRVIIIVIAFVSQQCAIAQPPNAQRPAPSAFLNQHCVRCHGPEKQESQLRLDTLTADFTDSRMSAVWIEVRDKLNLGEMPPADEPQPDGKQVVEVTKWIAGQLRELHAKSSSTGGQVLLRRLSRTEYVNTVRDLLKVTFIEGHTPREILPPDGTLEGFDKMSKALLVDPSLMEKYYEAARRVADRAIRVRPPRVPTHTQHFEFEDLSRVSGFGYQTWKRSLDVTEDGILLLSHDAGTGGPYHPYNGRRIPTAGKYAVRVRAGASRGDSDKPVYMDIRYRDGVSKRFEVDTPIDKPKVYEWVVSIDPTIQGQFAVATPAGNLFEGQAWENQDISLGADKLFTSGQKKESLRIRAQLNAENLSVHVPSRQGFDKSKLPKLFLDYFEVEGPLHESFPPASTKYLMPKSSLVLQSENAGDETLGLESQAKELATNALKRILPRAFRRPLRDGELEEHLKIITDELALGKPYHEALKVGLISILCSPDFLFLFEGGTEALGDERLALGEVRDFKDTKGRTVRGKVVAVAEGAIDFQRESDQKEFRVPITAFSEADQRYINSLTPQRPTPNAQRPLSLFELATRLSYFLWSSMPDDELFQLAAQNKLTDPTVLAAQVDRMLADPKSEALVTDFAT